MRPRDAFTRFTRQCTVSMRICPDARLCFHLCCRWVEKYRPMILDDIVGNAEAVERMKAIASQGNMPNLIFSVRVEAPAAAGNGVLLFAVHSQAIPTRASAGTAGLREDDKYPLSRSRSPW